jgi:hypothetical protein
MWNGAYLGCTQLLLRPVGLNDFETLVIFQIAVGPSGAQ